MADQSNILGFKNLTLENWLKIDPTWEGFGLVGKADPVSTWISLVLESELSPNVPLNVQRLFAVARGTLAYSLMFYPLLALGQEQLLRVFEAAASEKFRLVTNPTPKKNFHGKIMWLAAHGYIEAEDLIRWDSVRLLRNEASHPEDQLLCLPVESLTILEIAVELIDGLFA